MKELKELFHFAWSYHYSSFQTTVMRVVNSSGLDPLPLIGGEQEHFGKGQQGLTGAGGSEWLYL